MDEYIVRPLANEKERVAYARLANAAFDPDTDPAEALDSRLTRLDARTDLAPELWRGAFYPDGERLLGGYTIGRRTMRIGPARLRTGCIGGVVTAPAFRRQGVARALLEDAIAFARANEFALLYLTGVPDLYHKFGFASVIETSWLTIAHSQLARLRSAPDIRIGPASAGDVDALVALYSASYNGQAGGFERSRRTQQQMLDSGDAGFRYFLARDADGTAVGYSLVRQGEKGLGLWEVATETAGVLPELLRHFAGLQARGNRSEGRRNNGGGEPAPEQELELSLALPPTSRMFYELAEQIPLKRTGLPHPSADWMARPGDVAVCLRGCLPLWQARWQERGAGWQGDLLLSVAGEKLRLRFGRGETDGQIAVVPEAKDLPKPALTVVLRPQALVQLLFHYRPVWWVAEQAGNAVPPEAVPILAQIFPQRPGWTPKTDSF